MASTLIDVLRPLSSPVPALEYCSSPPARLSRQEVFDLAQHAALTLSHPNRRVFALNLRNTFDFVVCFLAVTGSGGIVLPLNSSTTQADAKTLLEDAKVDCLIVEDPSCGAALAANSLPDQVSLFVMTKELSVVPLHTTLKTSSNDSTSSSFSYPSCNPADVALYLFTSGTTSKPKLVPLTHHNMMTSIANIRNTYELDETDRSYSVMPLFHIHGLQSSLFASLLGGGTVLLPTAGAFSASAFWRDVVEHGATWTTAVPTMHQILLSRAEQDAELVARHKLRFIRSCSSPLPPAVLTKLEKMTRVPVLEAYAMTEASHQICSNPLPHHGRRKPGSVGRATNVQVCLSPAGEVCIRGDNVLLQHPGYLNVSSPEVNRDAFASQGWFRTGDLGYLDDDGYLFLVGRSKEMVNRGGEKISPFEVDSAILEMPGVGEAVCFALPSEKYGEELGAAVVCSDAALTAEDVVKFCETRLTKVKVPSKVFVVDAIPKSATGKVQRRNLTTHFSVEKSKL